MTVSWVHTVISTIRGRVLVSFVVVALLLVFGSIGGYMARVKGQKIQRLVDLTHEQDMLTEQVASQSLEYVIQEGQKDVRAELVATLEQIDVIFSRLSRQDPEEEMIPLTGEEEVILSGVVGKYQSLRQGIDQLLKIRRGEVTVEDGDQLLLLGEILANKKEVKPELEKLIHELRGRAGRAAQRTLWIFFSATLVSVSISFLAILGARRIAGRFLKMQSGLFRLRDADLTEKIQVVGRDELAEIGEITNSVIEHLSRIVNDVLSASDNLASSSEELSVTCENTVKSTDNQAVLATQVSTAMQEMTSTVINMAQNASNSATAMKETAEFAQIGREQMGELRGKMTTIESIATDSSQAIHDLNTRVSEIVNIVRAINDIADQTNLLALNAAIEAARAGEQGRGFTVVADEVRKLAERTIKLTGEIAKTTQAMESATGHVVQTMEAEVKEVQSGVEGARETEACLQKIGGKVEEVFKMISQIAVATEEQSTVSEQIASDIETISSLTTDNANNTKEISTVSVNLAYLASQLQEFVKVFKVAGGRPALRYGTEEGKANPLPEGLRQAG